MDEQSKTIKFREENVEAKVDQTSQTVEIRGSEQLGSADEVEIETEKSKDNTKTKRPLREFPLHSIQDAIKIPKVIGSQNAGNPWLAEHVATALNTAKSNTAFFYLTSASRDYGFTTGTSRAKSIELTPLGRKIAFPESSNDEAFALLEAFNNIEVFKKVYEYYKDASFPEDRYFCNTLRETFNVDPMYHQDFLTIFKNNLDLLNAKQLEKNPIHFPNSTITPENSVENQGELFVIMPFSEKTESYPQGFFAEVFNSLIVPAASEAGYTARTANKNGSDIIHKTIVSGIYHANIILADLTEHNPNVLFELGLAIAFKKKVALMRAKGTKAIFDVDNSIRVLDYNPNLWKSTLEMDIDKLTKHIIAANSSIEDSYLDIFLKG